MTTTSTSSSGVGGVLLVFVLLSYLVACAPLMGVFKKAGQPPWAALIPIYNAYVLLRVVGRPGWWLILLIIPFVNVVVGIIVLADLAASFGKGLGYTIGLVFLSWFFLLGLWAGSSTYQGPAGSRTAVGY